MDQAGFLITGASGQLGLALQQQYPNARAVSRGELDITNKQLVEAFDWSGVKVILNAAAYTNVDGAETPDGRVQAWQVNAEGTANLAATAAQFDAILVHISTDYVFDGSAEVHTENEVLSPLSVYGASKAAGDIVVSLALKHYLFRTSWVIGHGKNFVRTMYDLGSSGIAPTVVADQIGRPTFTTELVRAIDHALQNTLQYGTYNVQNGGDPVSWADLTREIFKLSGFDLLVTDTTTEKYFASKPEAAQRPLNSVFDLSRLETTNFKPTDWRQELNGYLKNL